MLNNKNNKISALSIEWSPLSTKESSWLFQFNVIYSLVMLLGIALCLIAANWQYNKALFFTAPQAQLHYIQGSYLNDYTHFLDNQTLDGKAGYAVITPFEYDGSIYLVNRGFLAYENRLDLPIVPSIGGNVGIAGFVKDNHKPLLLNEKLQDPLNLRLQFVDSKKISKLLNKPIKDRVFFLKEGPGLLSAFPEKSPYLSHHRHMGYAVQWMMLALAGGCIWLLASFKRGVKS